MKATVILSQGEPTAPTHLEVELRPDEGDDSLNQSLLNLPDGMYAIRRFDSNGVKGWHIGPVKTEVKVEVGPLVLVTFLTGEHARFDVDKGIFIDPIPTSAVAQFGEVEALRQRVAMFEKVYTDDIAEVAARIGDIDNKAKDFPEQFALRFEELVAAMGEHGPEFRKVFYAGYVKLIDLFVEERKKKLSRQRPVRKRKNPKTRYTRPAKRKAKR